MVELYGYKRWFFLDCLSFSKDSFLYQESAKKTLVTFILEYLHTESIKASTGLIWKTGNLQALWDIFIPSVRKTSSDSSWEDLDPVFVRTGCSSEGDAGVILHVGNSLKYERIYQYKYLCVRWNGHKYVYVTHLQQN